MAMVMQDMNPGVTHQTKATFKPGKSQAAPAPPQPTLAPVPPKTATVQRVARLNPQPETLEPDPFAELEAEFAQVEPAVETPALEVAGDDLDVDTILKRYKGSPEEIARQLAKSFGHSEKRMRQLEHEKQLLTKAPGIPQQAPQTVAPQAMTQVRVEPQLDYKKWGDSFLDKPDERAKELEQHIRGAVKQETMDLVAPLYGEAMENRLFRKFPDIVTEDNLDVIKAMAHTEPGANPWERMTSAVKKYQTSMPTQPTVKSNPDVQAMQQAGQTPSPQATPRGEKKMYKQSYLRDLMESKIRTGDYQRDPKWRNLIATAYSEGRVLRGQ